MSSNITTPKQYFTDSANLPLSCMFLKQWVLVRLQGIDAIQYLHNQFTCNIQNLNKSQYTFAAHCNPHGKMISNMYVFHFQNQEIAFIQRISVCEKQIKAMKKYAVFSKITIIPDYNTPLVGIAGKNARQYLNIFFTILPNKARTILHTIDATILYFDKPSERFLLIINNEVLLHHLLNQSKFNIKINNSCQWMTLDIEAGYPWIESITSEMFIPQAINMDTLQGISFNKGCYIGQESITRIQYHGKNKKTLFRLINITSTLTDKNNLPKIGEYLTLQIKNKKCKGAVLQISRITQYNTWIQIILNKTILEDDQQASINNTIYTNDYLIF